MNNEEHNILKTKDYASQSAEDGRTQTYGTQTDSRTDRTTTHNLGTGDSVQLAGSEYRIEGIISGEKKTGEALIYLIRDNNGNDYALKLYYPFRDARDEPNSEALKRIKEVNNPDILKLHQFGIGAEKFNGQFCYEICDYANGGDLLNVDNIKEKYTPEFIERHVIKEIFKGIQVLHENRIYHCDLKPHNVFYLDENQKDLVIGDYGSAKTFEQSSEKELSYMSVVKGTDFYLAPEQAIGIISEKNDYYSFGMIILHLLYPDKIDQQTLRKIYERRAAEKPIIDYDPKYKRLNNLIAGLTLQDIQQRWGPKEVSQWLAGKSVTVTYKKAAAPAVMPIKLGSLTIQTEEDLIDYVGQGEEWYSYLINDEQGYHLLLTWLSQVQNLESKQRFDLLMKMTVPKGARFVRETILRYFVPNRPVHVITDLIVFDTDDPEKTASDFVAQLEDQWKIVKFTEMTWYLFCFGMALEQYALTASEEKKKSAEVVLRRFLKGFKTKQSKKTNKEEVIHKRKGSDTSAQAKTKSLNEWELISREVTDDDILRLFYEFNPERTYRDLAGKPVETLEEIGLFFAGNPASWDNRFLKPERVQYLKKLKLNHLTDCKREDFLFKIFENHLSYDIEILSLKSAKGEQTDVPVSEDAVTIEYQIMRSADPFLEQHNIKESLKEVLKKDDIIISPFISKNVGDIVSPFLLTLEKKYNIPENAWTLHSMETMSKTFSEHQADLRKKAAILRRKNLFRNIKDTFASFLYMLPVVLLYQLALAYIEKNFNMIAFLSGLSPFPISFNKIIIEDDYMSTTAGGLMVLSMMSILPSWIVSYKNYAWFIGIVFFNITFCALWFALPLIMTAITLIANPIGLYATKSSRIRLVPFLISLIPILVIIFIGDYSFKNVLPSSQIAKPLNVSGILVKHQPLRTGHSEGDAVIYHTGDYGTNVSAFTDTVNVVDEKSGWYLIQFRDAEGYVPINVISVFSIMQGRIHKRNSFVMSAPSDKSDTIQAVPKGETISIIAVENDWYRVQLNDYRKGYLHVKDVQIKDVQMRPAEPLVDPRDGQIYQTIKIGDQVWMAENMNYDAGKGVWCYKNISTNCSKHGKLYDWEAAKRAVLPGWRLPAKDDFETLLYYFGGSGAPAYKKIIPGRSPGFNALFGGERLYFGYFGNMGISAQFWSATGTDFGAWHLYVTSRQKTTGMSDYVKGNALSVRLIKD